MGKILWKKELKGLVPSERIFKELLSLREGLSESEIDLNQIDLKYFGYSEEAKVLADLLRFVKKKDKKIVVYTDYDADGVTGGAILWETLYLLGFDVIPYVPDRKKEGYGFSYYGLDFIKENYDPGLIISVDHGISAADKVDYAKNKLGIPVVITDHHLKPEELPDKAEAIIHISEISGSAVSYFVSKAIFNSFSKEAKNLKLLEKFFQADYLVLSTIGLVADLVPLVGVARSLVKSGLKSFPKVERVGLRQLLKEAGILGKEITPYDIGFIIAPRINAVGRLEHAIDALRLLCTRDYSRASKLANKLGRLNRLRQKMVQEAVDQAVDFVKQQWKKEIPPVLIAYSPDWEEGIIGLIASKLVEEFYRPAIVFTDSESFLKASARSIEEFHITDFLRNLKDYLLEVGGHKQAAGLKMEKHRFEEFKNKALIEARKILKGVNLERKTVVDLKLDLQSLSLDLINKLKKLEPYGVGNPQPSFYTEGEIFSAQIFGKNSEHLKLILKQSNKFVEVIAFGKADLYFKLSRGEKIGIAYRLNVNSWKNFEKLQCLLYDVCFL